MDIGELPLERVVNISERLVKLILLINAGGTESGNQGTPGSFPEQVSAVLPSKSHFDCYSYFVNSFSSSAEKCASRGSISMVK